MNRFSSSPEMDYITACLARLLGQDIFSCHPPSNLDWDRFVNLLESHRLASIFYTLGQTNKLEFPNVVRRRLKESRYRLLLYGDQCRHQVKEILTALKVAGIPLIVMKGWAFIPTLYADDHSQRYCADIDILIKPRYIPQSDKVLAESGYRHVDEVTPGYSLRHYNARAYILADNTPNYRDSLSIGLHWGLTHYPFYERDRIDISAIFKRALPLKVVGQDVLEMCVEDQVVYTCAHLSLHHRHNEMLLNYYEIAAIIHENQSVLKWQELLARAQEWGYLVQLQNTIQHVNDFWPQVIPADVFTILMDANTSWKDRLTDRLVDKTKRNRIQVAMVELLNLPGFWNKADAIALQLFPEAEYMRARYCIPVGEKLFPHYLKRIWEGFRGVFG